MLEASTHRHLHPEPRPLQQFGRYALSERIASGGMAEVFRGALIGPLGFVRPLAIKRIREESAQDPEFVQMLVDEARIASTLRHPNVVQVTDLGQIDGLYFIAMEYVSGRHLGQVIASSLRAGQPIPRAFSLHVVKEALMGLAHAHTKLDGAGQLLGIVHRDVSPQNILVGYDGSVRMADFGIAKALGRGTQTDAGVLKGKFAYMAPEQARGESVDARADLYAMGVVLFEALANKRMYSPSLDTAEIIRMVTTGVRPAIKSMAPDLPEPLCVLVDKALGKERDERFQTAEEFATELGVQLGRLAPGFGVLNVSNFMKSLFGPAVAEEERKLSELDGLARSLSQAQMPAVRTPPPVQDNVHEMATQAARPSTLTPATPPPKASFPVLPAALMLAGVVAVGAALMATRRDPGPPASDATKPAAAPVTPPSTPVVLPTPTPVTTEPRPEPVRNRDPRPRPGPVRPAPPPVQVEPPPPVVVPAPAPTPAVVRPRTVLHVDSVPAGATVSVNGEARGVAPLDISVEEGSAVTVSAVMPGRFQKERRVTPRGEKMNVLLDLPSAE
jgi:serine/threonine protein kinase